MQKNRLPLIFTLIAISVLMLVSCGPGELGTEENPLSWGLVPSGESERVLSGFEEVADMIFEESGLVIDTFVATEYAGVIEAMCADPPKAHMASLATFAYIIASDKGCADVDLVSVRYGDPTYSGQIFVRADSGITSVAEAAGKTWCRADPTSTSSWVIPTIYLKAAGIDPDTDLAQVVDAGSHEAAVAGVYNGDCDLGASYIDARTRVEGKEGLEGTYDDIMDAIVIIETFSGIPNDGVQYVPSLDAEIREKITSALLAIAESIPSVPRCLRCYCFRLRRLVLTLAAVEIDRQ
jgi:phosphonate transport system substrate-binding protein